MVENDVLPEGAIASRIFLVRGRQVMLSHDLADLYGVPTKRLNEQVKRNIERFPVDFMFQLTAEEWADLRSQNATSSSWGGRRTTPFAFSEHGVLMLSGVLNSERAIAVSIRIMRVFVRLQRLLQNDLELKLRVERLEGRQGRSDDALGELFEVVRRMMDPPVPERRRIGYRREELVTDASLEG